MMNYRTLLVAALLGALAVPAQAGDEAALSVSVKRLTMEAALKIAQGAIKACRDKGIQVGVTVVDRGGHPQVILRDVLAPDLTLMVSQRKAYTAMSFNAATSAMESRQGSPYGINKLDALYQSQ
jgi:hypothetical protein